MLARSLLLLPLLMCACAHGPKWGPAPAAYPAGTEMALLEGNPKEPGPFTLQVRFPPGTRLKPHRHPAEERAQVLSGVVNLGFGDQYDEAKTEKHAEGSSYVIPQGQAHFAWTDEGCTLEVHGTGPWGVQFVDAQ